MVFTMNTTVIEKELTTLSYNNRGIMPDKITVTDFKETVNE